MDDATDSVVAAGAPPGSRLTVGAFLRRVPFTTVVVVVMLLLAVASGTLWTGIESKTWYPQVAFGLPSFEAGRFWTVGTGAFFALVPVYYVLVAGVFAVTVGFAEWRMGTGRTMAITIGGHLAGVLGCALLLALFREVDWPWAVRIAGHTDVGFSAGMMAAICVVSMTLRPPWSLRILAGAVAYPVISFTYFGSMADIEHLIAVLIAAPLAVRLAGPHAVPQGRPRPAEWRLLLAIGAALIAVLQLVVRFLPAEGPTGSSGHLDSPMGWHVAVCVLGLLIAVLLWRGYRTGWVLAVGWTIGTVVLAVWATVARAGSDRVDHPVLYDEAPTLLADAILLTVLTVFLFIAKSAFTRPLTGGRLAVSSGAKGQ